VYRCVRAIPGLKEWRCRYEGAGRPRLSAENLLRLTAAPSPKLTVCEHLPSIITVEAVPALMPLADTLRAPDGNLRCRRSRPILLQFKSLTSLHLRFHDENKHGFSPATVEAIEQMTHLPSLSLTDFPWQLSRVLASLLRWLSRLELLSIDHARSLWGLDFLQSSPPTLTAVRLSLLSDMSARQLHYQQHCRALHTLEIDRCFTELLDAFTIGMMTPRRVHFRRDLWPSLCKFSHRS
jgi:hypothetical protein